MLKMTSTHGAQRDRIVFHPAGRTARDDDPSITYSFLGTRHTITFDDVVAATGAEGIGTLDIIPHADARFRSTLTYNDTSDPTVIVPHPQRTASSDVGAYVGD